MTWGKLGPKGWGKGKAEGEPAGWLRQVIHTILEVVPGGVLRAGKKRYTDDATAGWWLGVDVDGVARFNIGDAAQFLKWTGELLRVRGDLTLEALLGKFEGGGVVWEDAAGLPVFAIGADADLGFITGLAIEGLHPAGLRITSEGSLTLTSVTGAVDVLFNRVINVADATANEDALNRRTGDGRYLRKTAGWSGSFATGDGLTVTVADGQVTNVG
jgi:hypothetical protein